MVSKQDIEKTMVDQALKVVREHDLLWLAKAIASYAPERRNAYAFKAAIPWWMIYALRGMIKEEERRRRDAIDAANRAAIKEVEK